MGTRPVITKAGNSYYAKLPGNLSLRVDYCGNHAFVDVIPEGSEIDLNAYLGEPPTPVLEKIKLAIEVAEKTCEKAPH